MSRNVMMMQASLLGPAVNADARPPLLRARSHTSPSIPRVADEEVPTKSPPHRPTAGRSHSFYSSTTPKARGSQNPAVNSEKSSRLHIPGTSHGHQHHHNMGAGHDTRHSSRHRHTKSEVNHKDQRNYDHYLLNLTPSMMAQRERDRRLHLAVEANELRKINSSGSHQGNGVNDWTGEEMRRRRANSDPKNPIISSKSPIEIAIDQARARKMVQLAASTQKDVDHGKEVAEQADSELRERLAKVGRTSADLTRRLDYTYYSLLEKLGNLVATIQSFQGLSKQTTELIDHFAKETEKLDKDLRSKAETYKNTLDERDQKVTDLEQRGTRAGARAKDIGKRLEAARAAVVDWERREGEGRKRWGRVWRSFGWTLLGILALIALIYGRKGLSTGGDPVRAALGISRKDRASKNSMLNETMMTRVDIPDDVRSILEGIEQRQRGTSTASSVRTQVPEREEDRRLMVLDEL